jgi:hypothetical protein
MLSRGYHFHGPVNWCECQDLLNLLKCPSGTVANKGATNLNDEIGTNKLSNNELTIPHLSFLRYYFLLILYNHSGCFCRTVAAALNAARGTFFRRRSFNALHQSAAERICPETR